MLCHTKFAEVFLGRDQVRMSRLVFSGKTSKMNVLSINPDACTKSIFLLLNSFSNMIITAIFRSCGFSQITESIVKSITIYVVKLFFWPVPYDVEPNQTMRGVGSIAYHNNIISATSRPTGYTPSKYIVADTYTPTKNSCCWIIIQQLTNSFSRKAISFINWFHHLIFYMRVK